MIPRWIRSAEYSREAQWRRGGSSGERLFGVSDARPCEPDVSARLTKWLLLEEQEAGVQELEILGQVVQLGQC